MPRYLLNIEYNGANFCGSQAQNHNNELLEPIRTVQTELDQALSTFFKSKISTIFSSRTDAGVHAIDQAVSFDLTEINEIIENNSAKFLLHLNGILPNDIAAVKVKQVSENFHPRFDAKSRLYMYKIFMRRYKPVLRLDSMYWHKGESLNFEAMQRHAQKFLELKDFEKYTKQDANLNNYLCDIREIELIKESKLCYKLFIRSNRFLRHMVRNIVAELIIAGSPEDNTLNKDWMAPPEGLTLMNVEY